MEFVAIEGRAFVPTKRHDTGSTGGGHTPNLQAEADGEGDAAGEFRPERELAVAVFRQAFLDLGVQMDNSRGGRRGHGLDPADLDRRTAKLFLFDKQWQPMRNFWLAWLGMDEQDLWNLIQKPELQGMPNRVLAALEGDRATRRGLVTPMMVGTHKSDRVTATEARATRP